MGQFRYINKNKISRLPKSPGVYAFKNKRGFLYIGKASNIRERVKNHFQQPRSIWEQTLLRPASAIASAGKQGFLLRSSSFGGQVGERVGFIKTNSEIEALILEANLIKKYQPKYNVVWRDDKNYFFVAITREDYPRVLILHQKKENAEYLGPFVEGVSLKRSLTFLRKVFPYQVAKKHPERNCLWCNLKLCPGPNPNKKEYQKNIKNLIAVLKGKSGRVLRKLKKEMQKTSGVQNYEKAAKIRDQIQVLEKVISHAKVLEPPWLVKNVFQPQWKFRRIEAYDVSNIQGKDAAAAMVVFINGRPYKNFYRKFKIKIAGKPNDTAMLRECLIRRFKHLEWPLPDMILIDGGKAQLNVAVNLKFHPAKNWTKNIKIMAIAKRKNELYIEGREKPVLLKNLPREIFNLILQLRDETHRFAISYHRKLRQRRLLEK